MTIPRISDDSAERPALSPSDRLKLIGMAGWVVLGLVVLALLIAGFASVFN